MVDPQCTCNWGQYRVSLQWPQKYDPYDNTVEMMQ